MLCLSSLHQSAPSSTDSRTMATNDWMSSRLFQSDSMRASYSNTAHQQQTVPPQPPVPQPPVPQPPVPQPPVPQPPVPQPPVPQPPVFFQVPTPPLSNLVHAP